MRVTSPVIDLPALRVVTDLVGGSLSKLHKEATEALESSNYQKAIKLYEGLEARYPFGEYAAQTA